MVTVQSVEYTTYSSYHSAGAPVYLDAYDSVTLYQPGLYSGQAQVTVDWDEGGNVSLIYLIYSKTYTCDENGVCAVTDIPCDKIVSVVVQDGMGRLSCQDTQVYVYAYDAVTDRDYWYQSDSNLYHYHNIRPKPYAVVKVYYLP